MNENPQDGRPVDWYTDVKEERPTAEVVELIEDMHEQIAEDRAWEDEATSTMRQVAGVDRNLSEVEVWKATAERVIGEREEARAIADGLGNALDGCDATSLADPGVKRLFKRRRAKALKAWRYSSWYR